MPIRDIRSYKRERRENAKNFRKNLPADVKSNADRRIADKVLSLTEYKESSIIFIYISKDIEVDTKRIISAALSDGKTVCVPKCIEAERKMEFYRIDSADCLEKGCYGILEPKPELCEKIEDLSGGLCVVPGLEFDRKGYRLGFGMGYYDRFLSAFGGIAVGICYSEGVTKELFHGYFDRNVDILVTERYIKNVKGAKTDEKR